VCALTSTGGSVFPSRSSSRRAERPDHASTKLTHYSMLNKVYRSNPEGQTRYNPAKCIGCTTQTIGGDAF
jgi:hypothetical protein